MLQNRKSRLLAAGLVTGLLATLTPMAAAHAATEPSFPSTSAAPVYLVDGMDNIQYAAGTQMAWNAPMNVHLSAIPMPSAPADPEPMRLPAVSGAEQFITFIASPGDESIRNNWKAYGTTFPVTANQGVLMPNVTPTSQVNGLPGQAAVKAAGGTYSLGVAYVKNNGLTVISAYFTTINVDAGTGAWKFATPTVAPAKTDTTTTVSAPAIVGAGSPVTLTASVAAGSGTPSGNVEFFDGATSLGISAYSGTATLNTNTLSVGSHIIKAVYAGDASFNGSTSADFTIQVNDAATGPAELALVAGNAGGLTATVNGALVTVNGPASLNGKLVNVFGYSSPTFLGQQSFTAGSVTVSASVLGGGDHKIALVDAADASTILGWVQITLAAQGGTGTRDLEADVVRSVDGEFKLIAPANATPAKIGNPTLIGGQSVSTGTLGDFTVVDDRVITKKGWDLTTSVAEFKHGTDIIANTALGLAPKSVTNSGPGTPALGSTQIAGSAVYASKFAELAAGSYSPASKFNADLTFKAPLGSAEGTYTSTLTLTLVSK
jgi:hypothetical protein